MSLGLMNGHPREPPRPGPFQQSTPEAGRIRLHGVERSRRRTRSVSLLRIHEAQTSSERDLKKGFATQAGSCRRGRAEETRSDLLPCVYAKHRGGPTSPFIASSSWATRCFCRPLTLTVSCVGRVAPSDPLRQCSMAGIRFVIQLCIVDTRSVNMSSDSASAVKHFSESLCLRVDIIQITTSVFAQETSATCKLSARALVNTGRPS